MLAIYESNTDIGTKKQVKPRLQLLSSDRVFDLEGGHREIGVSSKNMI